MASRKKPVLPKARPPPIEEEEDDSDSDDFGMAAAFQKSAAQPVQRRRLNAGNGSMNRARARGIILETSLESFNKKAGGTIPKRKVLLGCPTVYGDGADNFVGGTYTSLILPTVEKEGSEGGDDEQGGEQTGQGAPANPPKRKERFLNFEHGHDTRCRRVDGSLSVTLYVESLNPDKTSDVGRMKVGDIIELWGLEAVPGLSKTFSATLYLNAGGGKIITEGPPPAGVPRALMAYARDRQNYALHVASSAKDAFFGAKGLNAEQTRQATLLQKEWTKEVDLIADGFRSLSVGKDADLASQLGEQFDHMHSKGVEYYAAGNEIVTVEPKYDKAIVPLMLFADTPAGQKKSAMPLALKHLKKAKKDDEFRKTLPSSMLAGTVSHIEFYKEGGTGFVMHLTTVAVPDVDGAVEALKGEERLHGGLQLGPSIVVDQTIKNYQRESCRDPALVKMFVNELFLGHVTGTLFAKMGSVVDTGGGLSVSPDWPLAGGINLVLDETLQKGTVLVSKDFVTKWLCDGNNQFVVERALDAETALPLTNDQEPVTFAKHGVQELTSGSWKFSQLEPDRFKDAPKGVAMATEYRFLFEGARNLLADNDLARTDAEVGEKAMAEAAKAVGKSVKDFAVNDCLAYAVAVPA